jgi:hypothetical protein
MSGCSERAAPLAVSGIIADAMKKLANFGLAKGSDHTEQHGPRSSSEGCPLDEY